MLSIEIEYTKIVMLRGFYPSSKPFRKVFTRKRGHKALFFASIVVRTRIAGYGANKSGREASLDGLINKGFVRRFVRIIDIVSQGRAKFHQLAIKYQPVKDD